MKPSNTFKIPSLDGIRALSFLIVFISHDRLEQVPGLFGVAVFFFLSGYLITTLMRMEIEATGICRSANFFLRRAFRILPPFYLVLLLILWIVRGGMAPGNLHHVGSTGLVLLHDKLLEHLCPFHHDAGVQHLLVAGSRRALLLDFSVGRVADVAFAATTEERRLLLLGICGLVLLWRCILVFKLHSLDMTFGPVTYPLRTMYATDTRLDSILFGSVLALWGNPILDRKTEAKLAGHPVVAYDGAS